MMAKEGAQGDAAGGVSTVPNSNAVAKLCADLGVAIIAPNAQSPKAGETTARACLHRLYRDHGPEHLVTVLRVFMETENINARIDAFAVQAVSDVALAHPEWPNTGLRWLEIMDRIDLSEMQRVAKENRDAVPQRFAIATMLHQELTAAFSNNSVTSTRENVMPIDNDLLYGTKAIADYLEMPKPTCSELIREGKVPTFKMPGSTTRCARKTTLNQHWAECERAGLPRAMAG